MHFDYDFIVIGSGFGGSVSALRLAEKGYTVGVLEMGKRYRTEDFPKTNWNLRKHLWAPLVGLQGIFRMTLFNHAWVLTGTGVGGGSLVYSNTLWVPPKKVWKDTQWAHLEDWENVLLPFYNLAQKMLGAAHNEYMGNADLILQDVAQKEGYGDTFYTTNVSIFFGEPDVKVPDPYFSGEGPDRVGCNFCGGCMVGCRVGAKNTLDLNYLYLAEKRGAVVIPATKVVDVRPLEGASDGSAGYEITTVNPFNWFSPNRTYRAKGVVFSAGSLGTVDLLLTMKDRGSLPNLSGRVGDYVRTNSESIIGVRLLDTKIDVSDGVCIGSGIFIGDDTHIEIVRYSKGADVIAPLTTLLSHPRAGVPRALTWLATIIRHPLRFLKSLIPFGFAKSTLILLAMQTLDSHIQFRLKRSWVPPFKKKLVTQGPHVPTYIEKANQVADRIAADYGGTALTAYTEIFLNVPTTAHLLGGAAMGRTAEEGVINSHGQVFNYRNMYVVDGSMIGANLGVNPSLTITALAEYAMSHVPSASEQEKVST